MPIKLKEAYEWSVIPTDLNRKNLVLITAKTPKTTLHAEDIEYPIRIFKPEELQEAARSLAQRPIGINHMSIIEGAFTVDAQWNNQEQSIEALIFLPDYWINKIKEGIIKNVSVEYTWRTEKKTTEGTIFEGFVFNRVDLLDGINAGDSNTRLQLVEGIERRGLMEGIIETTGETDIKQGGIQASVDEPSTTFFKTEEEAIEFFKVMGEPFAGYKDFDDCVAKNKDKKDPKAYCATIMRKVEKPKGEAVATEGSALANIPEVNIKEANLTGKVQVPEKPVSDMAQEPNPLTAIHAPLTQPMNPSNKVTSIGAIGDDKGPILPHGEGEETKSTTTQIGDNGGEPILLKVDTTSAKLGVESSSEPKKEEKKEEVKKEEVKQEPVKEEPKKEEVKVEEKKEEKKVDIPQVDAKDVRITELEGAVTQLQEQAKVSDKEKREAIEKAKKEMKKELIKELESILPPANVIQNFNRGGQVIANDVRKKVHQLKESLKE